MNAIDFGLKLMDLHLGANRAQLRLRAEDDMRPYAGKKIPLTVTFSCTHRCNLVCVHCQSENSDTAPDLPTERFLSLIDEIADAGAVRLGFTGGEPLLRSDIGPALELCRRRGLITTLVTNGFPVHKHVEDLRRLSLLFVSLDGGPEVNDRIRGEKSFEKFLEAVSLAQRNGIPVAALTTLSSMNFSCYREIRRVVEELGIHWMVGVIQTRFTRKHEQDFADGQLAEMLDDLSRSKNLRTSKGYLDFVRGGRQMEKCFAGIGYGIIAPDGTLYPCFPAQFDKSYTGGVDLKKFAFGEAFRRLPLYRATCGTCALACHAELNGLYLFGLDNILQCLRMSRPAASPAAGRISLLKPA